MENQEEINNSETNIIESQENPTSVDNGDTQDKEKRKRRSKNDPSGRQHKCEICGKTYLSRPALSQHIKTKHQDRLGEYKRGRGRPRKCESDLNSSAPNNKYKEFFNRTVCIKNSEEEGFDFRELLLKAISELYEKFGSVLNPENKEAKDHVLYNTKVNEEETTSKNVTYDESIIRYLQENASKVNKDYFIFMVKFCFLFRESYNRLKKKESEEQKQEDYSSLNSAEEVPDKCNDFITEFMEIHGYFEIDSGEIIEIIQHFCRWLYENGFTTSVLSLV